MKKLTILMSVFIIIVIGGGLWFYFGVHVPQQERNERIERERAKPCYGVELLDSWVKKEQVMFNYHEYLYVKVRNSSNQNKYVTIKFNTSYGWYTEKIKVYANDIYSGKLDGCDYKNCFKGGVQITNCE